VQTSDSGLKFVATNEGIRNTAYPDPATGGAPWTIGVGHTGPEVHPGLYWSTDQVMAQFRKDIVRFESAVNAGVKVKLMQDQFDALVDFTFNVGESGFLNSTLLKKLNAGNTLGAADEFMKWNVPAMLIGRRDKERSLFLGAAVHAVTPVKNVQVIDLADVQRVVGATPDGVWGPDTERKVRAWQAAHDMPADGIVGPRTAIAMGLVH
jgi:lysozyme